ncbi:uncharacterized protein PITG_07151 [Phytophthora infestans T30-4]|uniref:Transmembrane protein n=1 Tax=Phytophthora infestans (strain T30-4) TaxID=403677 RepID=D0N7E4_PHYIT|nr:uncharacterized protein PITG_07151 [Phytophthora infestans T30-4]EEY53493.1 conserved hypothetical protein [Phytophthora infestans T30-4]|eukprot:XP_002905111.1 conserved hypothetical protein [Phytophthora infestans T30-4]
MGLWPLALQVILVPQSVFGDGHGDRYEQLSYFAFENDHYQVLAPRLLDCNELQTVLFNGATPKPTTDLVRAVPQQIFEQVRAFVVNKTTEGREAMLSVSSDILGLPADKSVCFGGVDDEGAIQIEALLSAADSPVFGVDGSCLETSDSHIRIRLQSTEFYVPDSMGELNPSRSSGAMLITSLVGANLNPVKSSCYEATRKARNVETQRNSQYLRLVSVYSKQLVVPETCDEFSLYGGERDQFGTTYVLVPSTVANDSMWLSEWTVEKAATGEVLRQNFVNHKVNEVTVDSTYSIRLVISLQILALVVTAFLTSMRGWYNMKCAFVSPWSRVMNATTSCTIAKVVRSSYNFILVAQMVLGMIQWRKQLTIDLLVGADTNEAVLRAFGCGTLVVVLAINIVFARAGDLKMQEMEPSFAHVLLATGMTSVSASDVTKYSGCRGSAVCAKEVSLGIYTVVLVIVIAGATFIGLTAHAMLQTLVRKSPKIGVGTKKSYNIGTPNSDAVPPEVNSFTRFLDDRSRSTSLYDNSTEVYVQLSPGDALLSTRAQLEASGFVLATSILFRYRDLPLFLVARILPIQFLNFFNMTVTTYELIHTSRMLNEVPVVLVADQVIHTHWSKLKEGRLDWMNEYFGGNGETSYRSSRESNRRQSVQKQVNT